MSVNSYLENLAKKAIVRNDEKSGIQKSIDTIFERLERFDRDKNWIDEYFYFGSYDRGTIISRDFDDNSDIDIMVVFNDEQYEAYKPQTYLNYLKSFTKHSYPLSEIYQSHPAIVLELNHIKFELVPAIDDSWGNYKIPNKQNVYLDWILTNPNDLNGALCNNPNLRRLVRVAKIWNAKQGYIYLSYELEKLIVGYNSIFNGNLAEYFCKFCELLPINYDLPQNDIKKINTLKDKTRKAEIFDDSSYIDGLFGVSGWQVF